MELANLSAHQLGKVFKLNVDGHTVKVSALSYCYQVLKSEEASQNAQSCAAAIYNYYTATIAYRDAA